MYYRTMDCGGDNWIIELISYVVGIVLLAAIVAIIVKLVNRGAHMPTDHPHHMLNQKPLEIAKVRYAKGEISKEEFDQIKTDIED